MMIKTNHIERDAQQARFIQQAGFILQDAAAQEDIGEGNSLDDVVRDEHEVPRRRLREQLGREPTEEEISEWLRQHTEGY